MGLEIWWVGVHREGGPVAVLIAIPSRAATVNASTTPPPPALPPNICTCWEPFSLHIMHNQIFPSWFLGKGASYMWEIWYSVEWKFTEGENVTAFSYMAKQVNWGWVEWWSRKSLNSKKSERKIKSVICSSVVKWTGLIYVQNSGCPYIRNNVCKSRCLKRITS